MILKSGLEAVPFESLDYSPFYLVSFAYKIAVTAIPQVVILYCYQSCAL